MKKILALILFCLAASNPTYSNIKLIISLTNPRIESGYWILDVCVQVPAGQTWKVGSSNIRIDWISYPPNSISVNAENPCFHPNTNLHNNANYYAITTTAISGGTSVSLNITSLNNCYLLTPGTYVLGSIRFVRLDTTGTVQLTIRTTSVMLDSLTQMLNSADWTTITDPAFYRIDYLTSESESNKIPKVFKMYNSYPNPFNPVARIRFDVPKSVEVRLIVYDVLAREVTALVKELLKPGTYEIEFDGTNYPSGVYFYKIVAGSFTETKKMILLK